MTHNMIYSKLWLDKLLMSCIRVKSMVDFMQLSPTGPINVSVRFTRIGKPNKPLIQWKHKAGQE